MALLTVPEQKRKADRVWDARAPWNKLYGDVYEYCLPMRRPSGKAYSKDLGSKIFDMTATTSALYFAGSLQRSLFPSGQEPFFLESGPVARSRLGKDAVQLDRMLGKIGSDMHPFFLTGDWDTAVHEACIDLGAGTGAIMPVKGDAQTPVMFVCIPFDDLAVSSDAWGRINYVSWRQTLTREEIRDGFPNGKFDADFLQSAKDQPTVPEDFYQDFERLPDGRWRYVAYVAKSKDFIVNETTRTQPLAVMRYYRVPGESYGPSPLLLSKPSIKTLNKAQELALKAAAIQMLGIWGYRAGGTFNPATVNVGPGQFWAMQSTGGVLGPDVSRIDPAGGRIDVAKMVIGDLRSDLKSALYDTRIQDRQGTPISAMEITAKLQQQSEVHIGAFGRLVHECMPVIIPRVAEILYETGYLSSPLRLDQFLIASSVRSPMAAALNADQLNSIAQYFQMVAAMAGPNQAQYYAKLDVMLGAIAKGLQIDARMIPTDDERKALQEQDAAAQAAAMLAQTQGIDPTKGLAA